MKTMTQWMATLAALLALSGMLTGADDALAKGFAEPPDSAKPHTWWHWMNGTITKEGITLDLEAMKKAGIGGVQIFNAGYFPAGPVNFMGSEWRAMAKHAIAEAGRLGLTVTFHNCAGWSSSGGPWNTPEYGMQIVVTSETNVSGPGKFAGIIAQPPTRTNYYRDIAVLAVVRAGSPDPAAVKITGSDPKFTGAKVVDGNQGSYSFLPAPAAKKPQSVTFEYAEPFAARSLTVYPAVGERSHLGGELQISDDGVTFTTVRTFGASGTVLGIGFNAKPSRFYRILFTRVGAKDRQITLSEMVLSGDYRIENFRAKAGFTRSSATDFGKGAPADLGTVATNGTTVDLTGSMKPDGSLAWDIPAGSWTIIRFGHTANMRGNHPAPKEGTGLECDKLSKEALTHHWNSMMQKVIDDSPGSAGKTLVGALIDSYEVGCQNWTANFREEFRQRRGYDITPYLPALTGRIVDSPAVSERFLWDYRRTIADLFNDYYFGHFQTLCSNNKLDAYNEPYGNGNFDELESGGYADMPMTEFWAPGGFNMGGGKLASSIAHTYGRTYVGAESFTSTPEEGRWLQHPFNLKALGDYQQCSGINRFIFHCYAHQPWTNMVPGMTMGPWGTHFSRTSTWWEQANGWFGYLARTQFLLQQGLFAADVCVFTGEDAPNGNIRPKPELPRGYDYDLIDKKLLLTQLTVNNGMLALPHARMKYRYLLLPQSDSMTPAVLKKIRDLVSAGATVIGKRPVFSPSLAGYPACDAEIKTIADEVWGDCDGSAVKEHAFGKGKVITGKTFDEIFTADRLPPDFEYSGSKTLTLNFIHRTADGADVYFVANKNYRYEEAVCTFRVAGRVPEFWRPDTGTIERCAAYRTVNGRTEIPIRFDTAGSVFVVFRKNASSDGIASMTFTGSGAEERPKADVRIIKAVYGSFPQEAEAKPWVDVTAKLAAMVKGNSLSVKAGNDLAGDPASGTVKELRVEYTVGGKKLVKSAGENSMLEISADEPLTITRARYGLLTEEKEAAPASTVDLTEKVAAQIKDGMLSIVINNTFAGTDPAPMIPKEFRIEYSVNGLKKKKTVRENDTITVPDDTPDAGALPAGVLSSTSGGTVLAAWQSGTFTITAGTKAPAVLQASVPAPLAVAGPWQVSFQPGRGAPHASVTLDKLVAWNEHTDQGIRYFSGTGNYTATVTIPGDYIRKNRRLVLDLGRVEVSAAVTLNGKPLGILWKSPYRVDITDACRAGANVLSVSVVNLWPNRLIGDEQLPADVVYNGDGSIKEWPSWLINGTPRTSGRLTFTPWKHWKKDADLVDSGLIGPVMIRAVEELPVK